jgi:FKBP-type peptidyl-prolyl cis-trans isomerase 2
MIANWCMCWALLLGLAAGAAGDASLAAASLSKPTDCATYAAVGDRVTLHWRIKVKESDTVVDDTRKMDDKQPLSWALGESEDEWIGGTFYAGAKGEGDGWDSQVVGMCKGERRLIAVPGQLGFQKGDEILKDLQKEGVEAAAVIDKDLSVEVELVRFSSSRATATATAGSGSGTGSGTGSGSAETDAPTGQGLEACAKHKDCPQTDFCSTEGCRKCRECAAAGFSVTGR